MGERIVNTFNVGIDLDNVLCDTSKIYCDLFNCYTGENFHESDLTTYDTTKCMPKQYKKLEQDIWNWSILYDYVHPLPDSQHYIEMLSTFPDIKLYVVSQSNSRVMKEKADFIRKSFGCIPEDNIIFMTNKSLLKLNVHVDDNIDQLKNGKYHKLLFTASWNKDYNTSKNGMVRVNNWDECYNEIIRCYNAWKDIQELYT